MFITEEHKAELIMKSNWSCVKIMSDRQIGM